jgi:hypothetical protein
MGDREGERCCCFGAKGATVAERDSCEEVPVADVFTGTATEAAVE